MPSILSSSLPFEKLCSSSSSSVSSSLARSVVRFSARRALTKKTWKAGNDDRMSFADSDALEKGTWSPYDVLEVSSSATQEEIRVAYKNKMKTFHPDVLKDDDDDGGNKASEINKAYVLLTKEKREHTDAVLMSAFRRRTNGISYGDDKSIREHKEGVVGPMNEVVLAELVVCGSSSNDDDDAVLSEVCSIDVEEIVIDEMQQFCSVMAFSSEMPLPVPIQVDRLENGVRMAFVRWDFETKHLEQIGSLWFEYVNDGAVKIARRWQKGEKREKTDELPGEKRILEDFYEHFNYLKKVGIEGLRGDADEDANVTREEKNNKDEQKGMKGALAMAMSFALPVLPTPPNFGKKVTPGGAYRAYAIRKNHKITDVDLGF